MYNALQLTGNVIIHDVQTVFRSRIPSPQQQSNNQIIFKIKTKHIHKNNQF